MILNEKYCTAGETKQEIAKRVLLSKTRQLVWCKSCIKNYTKQEEIQQKEAVERFRLLQTMFTFYIVVINSYTLNFYVYDVIF